MTKGIRRLDNFTIEIENSLNSRVYANDQIIIEPVAVEEANVFSQVEGLTHLSFTPDFHKGSGTPIGTVALVDRVYPKIVGTDQGCGMRLDVLSINDIEITSDLKNKLRGLFFEGKREVLVGKHRKDILAYGQAAIPLLSGRSVEHVSTKVNSYGKDGWLGDGMVSDVLEPYYSIASDRDNIVANVGGGNHFVEIQIVDEIVDKREAFLAGLKLGSICVMVHTGSLDNGHQVANTFSDRAKKKHRGKYPTSGYFALDEEDSEQYAIAHANACNFATVNRAILSGMVAEALDCEASLVYDLPHNFMEKTNDGYLHRKGACPAGNNLVLIPGSMGTRSCVAKGNNFSGTLGSAPHGAGRVLNRNASRNNADDLKQIEIVTKIDPTKVRSDIAREVYRGLAEEAPRAYKDITHVIDSVVGSGIGTVVAWMKPLLTIKG